MSDTQLAEKPQQSASVVRTGNRGLQFETMGEMWKFCMAVVNSGQIKDIETPEIALIRLQAGLELGLSPIWSLTNIMVTNGRPSVWGDGLLGLIQCRPDCEDVIESFEGSGDKLTAVCEVRRRGRHPTIRKFSVDDAKRANLWKDKPKTTKTGKGGSTYEADSGPWYSYPQRMLQMRARAWACRDAFADALRGLGVVEELEDIPTTKTANAREVREVRKVRLPGDEPAALPAPAEVVAEPATERPSSNTEVADHDLFTGSGK
jgi:hypothetical protein